MERDSNFVHTKDVNGTLPCDGMMTLQIVTRQQWALTLIRQAYLLSILSPKTQCQAGTG